MKIISWNVAGLRARLKKKDDCLSSLEQALFSQINENKEGHQGSNPGGHSFVD